MATDVRVLAFGGARDIIGAAEIAVALEAPESARRFLDRLTAQYPALAPHAGSLRLAVNCCFASWDDPVSPGDEVAVIPPVAGG